MTTLQEFLNSQYPTHQEKEQVKEIKIGYYPPTIPREQSIKLAGNQLNLSEYSNLEKIEINGSALKSKLTELNVSGCGKLIEVNCLGNQLTKLDLSDDVDLKTLWCFDNQLSNLNFLNGLNPGKLTRLNISNNNITSDLNPLRKLVNLELLDLSNNPFYGSLEPLQGMVKLKHLNISDTDLDKGLEYLPENIRDFRCSVNRKDAKVKAIYNLFASDQGKVETEWDNGPITNFSQKLWFYKESKDWIDAGAKIDDYKFVAWLQDIKNYGPEWIANYQEDYQTLSKRFKKYGLCKECKQPNTGYEWCQSCNIPRLKKDFNKWTSKNQVVDEFIKKHQLKALHGAQVLEWIPYEKFIDIEHLADGGFSKIYSARWLDVGNIVNWNIEKKQWKRNISFVEDGADCGKVILKSLNNSQNITTGFLKEIAYHKLIDNGLIAKCLGISQNPFTKNYLMIMEHKGGNLRQSLQNKSWLSFEKKLLQLSKIASGLNAIHEKGLVHRDFHAGNILIRRSFDYSDCYITDLGLSRPADESDRGKVYGVLPYVAPEVLRGELYTQASDIYSFGIVAYELFANSFPYREYAHDFLLALRICEGLRPNLDDVKIPQLLKDLISKCWDTNPEQRPMSEELRELLYEWYKEIIYKRNTDFYHQYQAIKEEYNQISQSAKYKTHPTEKLTSRLLDFKNLSRSRNSKEINDPVWNSAAQSLSIELVDSTMSGKTKQESIKNVKKQFSVHSQVESDRKKRSSKLSEAIKKLKNRFRPTEQNNNWTNFHSSFTLQLAQSWQNQGFTYEQARDWINIHSPADQVQAIQEPEYYAWLRDIKKVDSDWVLNHGDHQALKQEYQACQQQAQILHNPPANS